MNENLGLQLRDNARQELEKIKDLESGVDYLNKLKAIAVWLVAEKKDAELQTLVAEQKLRTQRILGSLIDKGQKDGEIATQNNNPGSFSAGVPLSNTRTLSDIGITRKQSSTYKAIASIPEEIFEKEIAEKKQAVEKSVQELTTAGMVELAKQIQKESSNNIKKEKFKEKAKDFKSQDIQIIHGNFNHTDLLENSVDLILTDPPYPAEFLPAWEQMFEVAYKILKPSCYLVAYANHQNLDKIFKLPNDLIYYWTFKLDFTLKPMAKGRNLIATWKPVLIFQKPPFKKIETTIEDCVKENKAFKNDERDMHDLNWAQSIGKVEYLMEKFSKPMDLIFEPFAGTGTTLIAAQRLKRKCIGYELEEKYIDLIKGRLSHEQ